MYQSQFPHQKKYHCNRGSRDYNYILRDNIKIGDHEIHGSYYYGGEPVE